jgi:hypothetical protein
MTMTARRQRKPDPHHPRCTLPHAKLRYKSMTAAERTLAKIILHGAARYRPRRAYQCEACGGWHLTSEEKR